MSVNMLTIHFIIFYKMIFNKAIPDRFKYNGNSNEVINMRTVYSSILYASLTKRIRKFYCLLIREKIERTCRFL